MEHGRRVSKPPLISCPVLQALMYPLLVACKSMSSSRRTAAQQVVDNVRHHSAALVKQVGHSTSDNHSLRI